MKKTSLLIIPLLIILTLALSSISNIKTTSAENTDTEIQDEIQKVRESRQAFKNAKAEEAGQRKQEKEEKIQTKREAAREKKEEAKQRMETKRKETLLHLIDVQIKHFENIKERVQKMPNITDELKTELAAEIDAAIQNLNDYKAKVESAEEQEEIKTLAKEIKDFFKSKRDMVKKIVEAIHNSRANKIMAKAEERLSSIQARIQELKDNGKNTDEIDALVEEAKDHINNAQEALENGILKEFSEHLKEAYKTFREIAKKAKILIDKKEEDENENENESSE
jgi:hypothetical protein